jgi:hypothetical protein
MPRLVFLRNLVALACVAGVMPAAASATICGPDLTLREEAHTAISGWLRRVFNIGQQEEVLSHAISVSTREASLDLEMANGRTRSLALRGGRVLIDGAAVGSYPPGGALDRAWRRALADGASLDTRSLLVALRSWRGPALTGDEVAAKTQLDDALKNLAARGVAADARVVVRTADSSKAAAHNAGAPFHLRLSDLAALDSLDQQLQSLSEAGTDIAEVVQNAPVRLGDVSVPAGQRVDGDLVVFKGNADVFGEVTGSVVALYGDVLYHSGAVIGRDAVSVGGQVRDLGGTVQGDIKVVSPGELSAEIEADKAAGDAGTVVDNVFADVRDVVAVFVALAMLGFGMVFFGRRYLEVVADTTTHSFGRSFVVGLLGQLLLLPTFAMLCVGLIFTIVGILVLPFAALAFVLAAVLAVVIGFLAVAHAVGETFTRRRMAHGAFVRAPNAYGYLFTGLIGLLGLWAAAALTGWMGPVVYIFQLAAAVVTWIAVTSGFGAVLLSRAGLRETFAGRHVGEMSDEYLWATPPATPTAAKMNMKG